MPWEGPWRQAGSASPLEMGWYRSAYKYGDPPLAMGAKVGLWPGTGGGTACMGRLKAMPLGVSEKFWSYVGRLSVSCRKSVGQVSDITCKPRALREWTLPCRSNPPPMTPPWDLSDTPSSWPRPVLAVLMLIML